MTETVIFGGTFNPVHNAHAEIMRLLAKDEQTDRLVIIPTALPPHKQYDCLADGQHRLEMCRIAAKGLKNAEVSDIEIKRQGKSYTVDTLKAFKELYGGSLAVACGGDMLTTLNTWKNYTELLERAEFIALYRVGTDKAAFDAAVEKTRADGGRVRVIPAMLQDVSSKMLRQMIKDGQDVSEYIPAEVYDYIKQNRLYI